MSNDAVISELSAKLAPVRRRSIGRETALLVCLGAAELALIGGIGAVRPDMGQLIGTPYMLWKLISLALVAAVSGATAIASLSPVASPRRGLWATVGLAVLAMLAGLGIEPAADAGALHRHAIPHAYGPLCAVSIIVLSLPMLGMLTVLMRRGAPAHPEATALTAGLGAGSWGALVFAFCCPSNDPLYVILWYSAGCAAVGVAARWLLPRGFRL
jgi:hypothetical protein